MSDGGKSLEVPSKKDTIDVRKKPLDKHSLNVWIVVLALFGIYGFFMIKMPELMSNSTGGFMHYFALAFNLPFAILAFLTSAGDPTGLMGVLPFLILGEIILSPLILWAIIYYPTHLVSKSFRKGQDVMRFWIPWIALGFVLLGVVFSL